MTRSWNVKSLAHLILWVLAVLLALPAAAAVFTVTTAEDNDTADPAQPMSLRKAIRLANSTPGRDTIQFNIGGSGTARIVLQNDPARGMRVCRTSWTPW